MRKTKPPFPDTDKVQQFNQQWGQMDTKKEKGKDEKVKYEETDYSSILIACIYHQQPFSAPSATRGDTQPTTAEIEAIVVNVVTAANEVAIEIVVIAANAPEPTNPHPSTTTPTTTNMMAPGDALTNKNEDH